MNLSTIVEDRQDSKLYNKVLAVIFSCETVSQLQVAEQYIKLAKRRYNCGSSGFNRCCLLLTKSMRKVMIRSSI